MRTKIHPDPRIDRLGLGRRGRLVQSVIYFDYRFQYVNRYRAGAARQKAG